MIRKLNLFDQSRISEASQLESAQESVSVSDRLGIAGNVDTFENATAISTDYSNFTRPQDPVIAAPQDPASSETVDASQIFDSIAEVQQPEAQPEQLMRWPDLTPRFGSGPSISLKSRITLRDEAFQTEAYHAEEITDRRRTSVEYASPNSRASAVDSISMPTALKEQLVDDLLRQIEQLLITVPPDQKQYFEEMFERKIKIHFYEAVANPWGGFSVSNVRYFPKGKDEIRWDPALEDFTMFLEELKAAQQPTQVPVTPSDVPPEG